MSPRQWLALLGFYTMYLFFGASVFYYTEHGYETQHRAIQLQKRIDINELLVKYTSPDDIDMQNEILKSVSIYCKKPVTNYTLDEFVDPHVWSFYHSVFFSFTVCSTLGYGNITPTHLFGRYFLIVYALIGMPVNAILYAYLGEFFGKTFNKIYKRYKAYKIATNKNYVPRRFGMIAQISLYLIPAAIVLIFLPSCLFTYFEGWTYSDSVYYSFVTLSTIGFGDFIPTFQPHQEREFGIYFQFYQAFVIIWLVFGLSYLLMLIGYIASGMRSKRIARLEHQLSENIKITHNRIWSGVTKDVSYLRRILNEIYMLKFKPVYDEDDDSYCSNYNFPRSASCPELQMYRTNLQPEYQRKRALSDFHVYSVADDHSALLSRHSESDLFRINKTKTFSEQNEPEFDTGEVLARVVHALSNITNPDDENNVGSQGSLRQTGLFSSTTSLKSSDHEYSVPPEKPRPRAVSAYRKPSLRPIDSPHKWTWNGTNAQIQEFRNIRDSLNVPEIIIDQIDVPQKNRSCSIKIEDSFFKPLISPTQHKFTQNNTLSPLQNANADQKRLSIGGHDALNENILSKRRASRIGHLKPPQNSSSRRPSIFDIQENDIDQNLLEHTTIADLIRALETAHTLNNSSNNPVLQELLGVHPTMQSKQLNNRRASMYPRFNEQSGLLRQQQIPQMNVTSSTPDNLLPQSKPDIRKLTQRRFSVHPNTLRRSSITNTAITRDDQLPLSRLDLHKFTQRRSSVHPNTLRRSSITNSTISSLQPRRQSMRPSYDIAGDTSEVTGRFTVSKRSRPPNTFRNPNSFLKVVQSNRNSLTELTDE